MKVVQGERATARLFHWW